MSCGVVVVHHSFTAARRRTYTTTLTCCRALRISVNEYCSMDEWKPLQSPSDMRHTLCKKANERSTSCSPMIYSLLLEDMRGASAAVPTIPVLCT